MFGIGFTELLVVAVAALIFVGPTKLPQLMRQAGRFFVQIRRATTDVRSTLDAVVKDAEAEIRREEIEATLKSVKSAALDAPAHAVDEKLDDQESFVNPSHAASSHDDPHHEDVYPPSPDDSSPDDSSPDGSSAEKEPSSRTKTRKE